MEYKYTMHRNSEENAFIIEESALVSNDDFLTLFCTASYEDDKVKQAADKGKKQVISLIRTKHFFPMYPCADKLAESILNMYNSNSFEPVDVLFDEKELLPKIEDEQVDIEADTEESDVDNAGELDELLVDEDIDLVDIGESNSVEPVVDENYDK